MGPDPLQTHVSTSFSQFASVFSASQADLYATGSPGFRLQPACVDGGGGGGGAGGGAGVGSDALQTHVSASFSHFTSVFSDSHADLYTSGAPDLSSQEKVTHTHVLLRATHVGWVTFCVQYGVYDDGAPGRSWQCAASSVAIPALNGSGDNRAAPVTLINSSAQRAAACTRNEAGIISLRQ